MLKTCVICGKEFETENSRLQVCSKDCHRVRQRLQKRKSRKIQEKKCKICGTLIEPLFTYCPKCKTEHTKYHRNKQENHRKYAINNFGTFENFQVWTKKMLNGIDLNKYYKKEI